MLDKIKRFIDDGAGTGARDGLPEEQVAVAAILLEVADVDRDFAPEEYKEIVVQLRAYFGLSREQVDELLRTTSRQREDATDLFPFTRAIAAKYSPEQKQEVLTMVWQVIFADDKLDPYEDQLARRLQQMLSVNQSVLIAAKTKAREIQQARADRG